LPAINVDDDGDMEAGVYEVQEEDPPLKEIYQCDEDDLTKLCIRDLAAAKKRPPRLPPRPEPTPPATEAAVTCGARRLGAALRFKPHHQITFAAKNLLNTNSRPVI